MDRSPSVDTDLGRIAPACTHWREADALRNEHGIFWNERGNHWVITKADQIREAGHDAVVFSNHSIIPTEPEPEYRFLPSHVDPPQHLKYRHVMNAWFAPLNIAKFAPVLKQIADDIVSEVAPLGKIDYQSSFGDTFPVRVLLAALGVPELFDDGPTLVSYVRQRARLRAQGDLEGSMVAWRKKEDYWKAIIADRRVNPRDPSIDFVTHLLNSTIDNEPLPDDDIVNILVTLTIGGVDTTKAQIGWCLYHLATHPEDLRRIVADRSLLPNAIEEYLRAYTIIGMGRKVMQDIDFHGCPMKKDDMVLLWYPAGSRDETIAENPDEIDIDRDAVRHLAFGASLHRCLGSHLARAMLTTSITAWIDQIPSFRLDPSAPEPRAIGNQIALLELPLVWP